MKTLLGMIVLSGAVVGAYYLNKVTRKEDGTSVLRVAGELPINVEAGAPTRRDIIRTVQAPGDIEAFSEVDISAEVVSKIVEMPVEEGNVVAKGALLCRLDDRDYRARLTSAEANVAKLKAILTQAEADLEKAERDFRRQVQLSENDATSSIELADYQTVLVRHRAGVEIRRQELIEAEAGVQSAKKDLDKTVITSPIDGIVAQRFAKLGEVVVMGTMNNAGTRIMVVSDLSKMQARCRVDEADAPLVKDEQRARIYLQSDPQNAIPGKVIRVATKGTRPAGRDVVTFETLVLVEGNDNRVKPGMATNVDIEVAKQSDAVTVPIQSVVYRKRRDLPTELVAEADNLLREASGKQRGAEYIKVIFSLVDGVARPRLVETGINDETSVEIVRGLTLEESVAIGPFRSLDQLKDGSKVKIDQPESKTGSEKKPVETEKQASAEKSQ